MLIAAAAMLAQGAYGNLHVDDGVLVGVPAVGGVLVGTSLQQRVDPRVRLAALRGRSLVVGQPPTSRLE